MNAEDEGATSSSSSSSFLSLQIHDDPTAKPLIDLSTQAAPRILLHNVGILLRSAPATPVDSSLSVTNQDCSGTGVVTGGVSGSSTFAATARFSGPVSVAATGVGNTSSGPWSSSSTFEAGIHTLGSLIHSSGNLSSVSVAGEGNGAEGGKAGLIGSQQQQRRHQVRPSPFTKALSPREGGRRRTRATVVIDESVDDDEALRSVPTSNFLPLAYDVPGGATYFPPPTNLPHSTAIFTAEADYSLGSSRRYTKHRPSAVSLVHHERDEVESMLSFSPHQYELSTTFCEQQPSIMSPNTVSTPAFFAARPSIINTSSGDASPTRLYRVGTGFATSPASQCSASHKAESTTARTSIASRCSSSFASSHSSQRVGQQCRRSIDELNNAEVGGGGWGTVEEPYTLLHYAQHKPIPVASSCPIYKKVGSLIAVLVVVPWAAAAILFGLHMWANRIQDERLKEFNEFYSAPCTGFMRTRDLRLLLGIVLSFVFMVCFNGALAYCLLWRRAFKQLVDAARVAKRSAVALQAMCFSQVNRRSRSHSVRTEHAIAHAGEAGTGELRCSRYCGSPTMTPTEGVHGEATEHETTAVVYIGAEARESQRDQLLSPHDLSFLCWRQRNGGAVEALVQSAACAENSIRSTAAFIPSSTAATACSTLRRVSWLGHHSNKKKNCSHHRASSSTRCARADTVEGTAAAPAESREVLVNVQDATNPLTIGRMLIQRSSMPSSSDASPLILVRESPAVSFSTGETTSALSPAYSGGSINIHLLDISHDTTSNTPYGSLQMSNNRCGDAVPRVWPRPPMQRQHSTRSPQGRETSPSPGSPVLNSSMTSSEGIMQLIAANDSVCSPLHNSSPHYTTLGGTISDHMMYRRNGRMTRRNSDVAALANTLSRSLRPRRVSYDPFSASTATALFSHTGHESMFSAHHPFAGDESLSVLSKSLTAMFRGAAASSGLSGAVGGDTVLSPRFGADESLTFGFRTDTTVSALYESSRAFDDVGPLCPFVACRMFLTPLISLQRATDVAVALSKSKAEMEEMINDISRRFFNCVEVASSSTGGVPYDFEADSVVITFNAFKPVPSVSSVIAACNCALLLARGLSVLKEEIHKQYVAGYMQQRNDDSTSTTTTAIVDDAAAPFFDWGLVVHQSHFVVSQEEVGASVVSYACSPDIDYARMLTYLCPVLHTPILILPSCQVASACGFRQVPVEIVGLDAQNISLLYELCGRRRANDTGEVDMMIATALLQLRRGFYANARATAQPFAADNYAAHRICLLANYMLIHEARRGVFSTAVAGGKADDGTEEEAGKDAGIELSAASTTPELNDVPNPYYRVTPYWITPEAEAMNLSYEAEMLAMMTPAEKQERGEVTHESPQEKRHEKGGALTIQVSHSQLSAPGSPTVPMPRTLPNPPPLSFPKSPLAADKESLASTLIANEMDDMRGDGSCTSSIVTPALLSHTRRLMASSSALPTTNDTEIFSENTSIVQTEAIMASAHSFNSSCINPSTARSSVTVAPVTLAQTANFAPQSSTSSLDMPRNGSNGEEVRRNSSTIRGGRTGRAQSVLVLSPPSCCTISSSNGGDHAQEEAFITLPVTAATASDNTTPGLATDATSDVSEGWACRHVSMSHPDELAIAAAANDTDGAALRQLPVFTKLSSSSHLNTRARFISTLSALEINKSGDITDSSVLGNGDASHKDVQQSQLHLQQQPGSNVLYSAHGLTLIPPLTNSSFDLSNGSRLCPTKNPMREVIVIVHGDDRCDERAFNQAVPPRISVSPIPSSSINQHTTQLSLQGTSPDSGVFAPNHDASAEVEKDVCRDVDIGEGTPKDLGSVDVASATGAAAAASSMSVAAYTATNTSYESRDPLVFELGQQISAGTHGRVVFMGLRQDGRIVAIKRVPLASTSSAAQDAEAAQREVDTLSRLKHDNIVRYIASCYQDSYLYIIMEHVSGGSLLSMLQNFGSLPHGIVRRYTTSILSGLRYLHEHNIVHRDVAASNVLVSIDGLCKLTDFGGSIGSVSSQRTVNKGRRKSGARLYTQPWGMSPAVEESTPILPSGAPLDDNRAGAPAVFGTPLYMSPQACGGVVHHKNDVWSVGVMVCLSLTGQYPWEAKDTQDVDEFMSRLACGELRPQLPSSNAALDTEVTDFINQCLEVELEDRPSAAELLMHPFIIH